MKIVKKVSKKKIKLVICQTNEQILFKNEKTQKDKKSLLSKTISRRMNNSIVSASDVFFEGQSFSESRILDTNIMNTSVSDFTLITDEDKQKK
jgi:hypothetical protein